MPCTQATAQLPLNMQVTVSRAAVPALRLCDAQPLRLLWQPFPAAMLTGWCCWCGTCDRRAGMAER